MRLSLRVDERSRALGVLRTRAYFAIRAREDVFCSSCLFKLSFHLLCNMSSSTVFPLVLFGPLHHHQPRRPSGPLLSASPRPPRSSSGMTLPLIMVVSTCDKKR